MTVRDHETIVADMAKVRANYHAAANTLPTPKLRELTNGIARLQAEEVDALRVGAEPCAECGEMPHAMQRTEIVNMRPVATYELGCLTCPPRNQPSPTNSRKVILSSPRVRGNTPEETAELWNVMNRRRADHRVKDQP